MREVNILVYSFMSINCKRAYRTHKCCECEAFKGLTRNAQPQINFHSETSRRGLGAGVCDALEFANWIFPQSRLLWEVSLLNSRNKVHNSTTISSEIPYVSCCQAQLATKESSVSDV
jgi:hypothetical protein